MLRFEGDFEKLEAQLGVQWENRMTHGDTAPAFPRFSPHSRT